MPVLSHTIGLIPICILPGGFGTRPYRLSIVGIFLIATCI
jgi:hypothetical protein